MRKATSTRLSRKKQRRYSQKSAKTRWLSWPATTYRRLALYLVFMQKETARKLILATVGLLIGLLAAESFVRWRGAYDEDGNFTFQGYTLRPYRLPIENTQEKIDNYLRREENAFIIYDDHLGWAPRPQGQSSDQLVSYNAAGLRSPVEYALEPGPDVFRIALFGDSFTHNEIVGETIAQYLLSHQLIPSPR